MGISIPIMEEGGFQSVLSVAGIDEKNVRFQGCPLSPSYAWRGKDILLFTKNNPITGEYAWRWTKEKEIGYLSYVGIEGAPNRVKEVAEAIKDIAIDMKDESPYERAFF